MAAGGRRCARCVAPQVLAGREKGHDLVDLGPAHRRLVADRVFRHLLQHDLQFGQAVAAARCLLLAGSREFDVPLAGEQTPPVDERAGRFFTRGQAAQRRFREVAIPGGRQDRPRLRIRHHDFQAAGREQQIELLQQRLGELKHRSWGGQRHVDIDQRLPVALRPRDALDLDVLPVDPELQLPAQVALRRVLRLEGNRLLAKPRTRSPNPQRGGCPDCPRHQHHPLSTQVRCHSFPWRTTPDLPKQGNRSHPTGSVAPAVRRLRACPENRGGRRPAASERATPDAPPTSKDQPERVKRSERRPLIFSVSAHVRWPAPPSVLRTGGCTPGTTRSE